MRPALLAFAAGVFAVAGVRAADQAKPKSEPPQAVSDSELSLYPGSVFSVPDPPGFEWNDEEPGENERLPRPFVLAPPRVPHDVAPFVPITLRSNVCLDCHALDSGAGAPELPESHRTDLRWAPATVGPSVVGARWLCVSCHVPTSDAPPLREHALPAP